MKPFSVLVPTALVLAVCLTGCGKGGEQAVLAEIGSRVITRGDYEAAYRVMKPEDRPPLETAEDKMKFLEDLINKEAMELAAFEAYPELTDRQQTRLKRYVDKELTEAVKMALIRGRIPVTKEMKDQIYENLSRERHLKAMLIADPDAAGYVRKQLESGEDWSALARDHSTQWVSDVMDGDLGWKKPGFLPYPVDVATWAAEVGSLVGPIEMPMGSYLVQVVEERPAEVQGTREDLDPIINEMLLEPLYLNRQKEVQDSLVAAINPFYPAEGKALLMLKYYFTRPEHQADNDLWYLDEERVKPTFTAEEAQMVVVDFKTGKDWTAQEFADRLMWYPHGLWPRGQSEEQLLDCLTMMMRDYLHIKAAEDMGFNNEEFAQKLELRKKEMRVTYFYYNNLMPEFEPSDDEINAYFVENRDRYRAAKSYKLAFFGSKNAELVENLRRDWKEGMSYADLRKKYEPRTDLVTVGESEWIFEGQDALRDDVVATLKEGGVSEVVVRADMSMVVKLIARRPERLLTYSEARVQVDEDAKTVITDRKLSEFLAKKREEYGVKIHEKTLAKIEAAEIIGNA